MKTSFLLPNGFKKIGWVIFIPTFLLGCSICLFNADYSSWFSSGIRKAIDVDSMMNTIAIVGTVLGALLIGFSREKIEDEMIQRIRLNSLLLAVWINYLLLIVASLIFYELAYLGVLSCNTATTLVIFLIIYHCSLYRSKRNLSHEE